MNRLLAAAIVVSLGAGAAPAAGKPAPPDPRRGERLDGRAPYRDPYRYALFVPRAVLLLPRIVAYAVLAPATAATRYVEEKHLWTRAMRLLTSDDGLIRVRPIASYESGFLPSVGLRWSDRRTLGPGTRMAASFRTAGTQLFEIDGALRPWDTPLELRGAIERDPNAVFGGIHGESRDDLAAEGRDVARYSFERLEAALVWEDRPSEAFQYGMGLDVVRAQYGNGTARGGDAEIVDAFCTEPGTATCTAVDESLVPGFNEGLRLVSAGGMLGWDSRGHERFATGVLIRISGRVAEGIAGDPSRHAGGQATACASLALGEREIDLCGRAGLVEPLGDAPVPFEELMEPGGTDGLRGISEGRLRGHSKLVGSLEYRWLLGSWIDASVFTELGGAFGPGFEDLSTDGLIPDVGLAVRYVRHDSRHYYWRGVPTTGLQLAWAPDEGIHLLFSVTR